MKPFMLRRMGATVRHPCVVLCLVWHIAHATRVPLLEVRSGAASAAFDATWKARLPRRSGGRTDDHLEAQSETATLSGNLQPYMVFGIKSGASEFARRAVWRQSNCSQIYASSGISYKFFTGLPYAGHKHILDAHDQGGQNTTEEQADSKRLLEEAEQYNDIVVLPMRDQYMSLPEKTWSLLKFVYDTWPQTPYIGTHDVEYCVRPEEAKAQASAFEEHKKAARDTHAGRGKKPNQAANQAYDQLFAGVGMFEGTEYESMKGADGKATPYQSGHGWFMSRGLVGTIVTTDRLHSVLYGFYGTSADDVDVGKWVQYAEEHHSGMMTEKAENPKLLWSVLEFT